MENLKVDNVVFSCDIDGKRHQKSVDFCFCCCDITNKHCLFSNGPVREHLVDALDAGDNLTKDVQTNPNRQIINKQSITNKCLIVVII